MQKHRALITSLFILSTTTLLAGSQAKPQQTEETSEPKDVTTQPKEMITPSVAPRAKHGAEITASADFIWWKTHIDGMEYGVTGINDAGSNVPNFTNTSKGHIHQPDFDFKQGFKLGLGLDFAHDGWDLFGEYTWLAGGDQKNSFSAKPGLGAASTLSVVDPHGQIAVLSTQKGSSKWEQHFNVLDLMLGRNFFISRYLTIRPSVGLKSAWIEEELKLDYSSTTVQFLSNGVISAKLLRKQNMWGLGARFGFDGVWHFVKNWGLYGNISVTALWSDFHVKSKTKTLAVPTPGSAAATTTNLNNRESIQNVMAVIETGLGVTYMTWFHHDKYQFQVQAGWEEQVWVNFNHFVETAVNGDLSLQGLTIKAGFIF